MAEPTNDAKTVADVKARIQKESKAVKYTEKVIQKIQKAGKK